MGHSGGGEHRTKNSPHKPWRSDDSPPCAQERVLPGICLGVQGQEPRVLPLRASSASLSVVALSDHSSLMTSQWPGSSVWAGFVFLGHPVSPGLAECLARHKEHVVRAGVFLELALCVPWAGAGTAPRLAPRTQG